MRKELVSRCLNLVESVASSRVCFTGDSIIDEYRYCVPLNKSPKENLIPVSWTSTQEFRGGVEAAANHVRSFCDVVDVHTPASMTRKVRFVELPYMRKVFEFQHTEPGQSSPPLQMTGYDIVIATDFGHGAFTQVDRERLSQQSMCYLAVNAQTNAANFGYNFVTNWPSAKYIVVDEPEARLAAQDRSGSLEQIIRRLAKDRCEKFIITRGTEGALGYDAQLDYVASSPAFTKTVVDTMGAGDAFFAVTSVLAPYGTLEELLVIGNAVGALKCQILGHQQSVTKQGLVAFLKEHL